MYEYLFDIALAYKSGSSVSLPKNVDEDIDGISALQINRPRVNTDKDLLYFQKWAHILNDISMSLNSQGNFSKARDVLNQVVKFCENYSGRVLDTFCLTLNNLSCVLQKSGKSDLALNAAFQAMELMKQKNASQLYLARTWINISAIYNSSSKPAFSLISKTSALKSNS